MSSRMVQERVPVGYAAMRELLEPLRFYDLSGGSVVTAELRAYGAALERYVRVLTGNCTQDQFPEIASSARKKLYAVRRELDKLPAKLRCMALGALYARPLYRMVRKAYDTATGAAHKYDVE